MKIATDRLSKPASAPDNSPNLSASIAFASALLFDVSPKDPVVFSIVAAVLLAVALLASVDLVVGAGEIAIVPPDTPHRFVNSGDGPLRQIDIHVSPSFSTEWL